MSEDRPLDGWEKLAGEFQSMSPAGLAAAGMGDRQDFRMKLPRQFATGAKRDTDEGKLDFEGFLHPEVLYRFAEYMHQCRQMPDGSVRDGDNWQKGIPQDVYMKSLFRHFMTVWSAHRRGERLPEDELCALLFNVQGLLFETLRD